MKIRIDLKKLLITLSLVFIVSLPVLLLAAEKEKIDVPKPPLLGEADLPTIIINIINIVLGFVGIVCIILIIFGGFKYMTAGGKEETMQDAKKILYGAIVGLIIVFAAWAIAQFLVSRLIEATKE